MYEQQVIIYKCIFENNLNVEIYLRFFWTSSFNRVVLAIICKGNCKNKSIGFCLKGMERLALINQIILIL